MQQERFPHPSWIEIDLKQFRKNLTLVRQFVGDRLLCLPIKANAYGHGLCPIGKVAESVGVDYLAVAHLKEGIELRQANVRTPILVLGAIHEDQILDLMNFNLEFTISSKFKADLVAQKCKKLRQKCRVHIEVDTGMQRTGVRFSSALGLYQHLKGLECFEIIGIYSHLAAADLPEHPANQKQIEAFNAVINQPQIKQAHLICHLANSAGITHFEGTHLDMVRPSLISFGYLPEKYPAVLQGIAPCFSLKTKVSYFKVVEKGEGISYGHSYVTEKQTRIATIPVGYGDGYRRSLSNKGSVLIRGKRFPIVGTICMDQFMVDIGHHEVYVGDEVVLIGKQATEEISLMEIARLCDTIPYEILCLFNERIPRVYVE